MGFDEGATVTAALGADEGTTETDTDADEEGAAEASKTGKSTDADADATSSVGFDLSAQLIRPKNDIKHKDFTFNIFSPKITAILNFNASIIYRHIF